MSIIEGRNAEILQSIIDGTPYEDTNPYPSRIEQLLMELKKVIEEGSGTTVDQTYTPTSENAQSGKAVAQALETIPSVTVDQTFDPASANAQSGVAVQQALQSIPSPQYHLDRVTRYASFPTGSQDQATATANVLETLTQDKVYFLMVATTTGVGKVLYPIDLNSLDTVNGYYAPYFDVITGAFIGSVVVTAMTATNLTFTLRTTGSTSKAISVAIFSYP